MWNCSPGRSVMGGRVGGMRSSDKFDVRIERMGQWDGKDWVRVVFKNDTQKSWIPSFEDLYRIVVPIGECEQKKYPYGRGRLMVSDFVTDAISGMSWADLRSKYQIPVRDELRQNDIDKAWHKVMASMGQYDKRAQALLRDCKKAIVQPDRMLWLLFTHTFHADAFPGIVPQPLFQAIVHEACGVEVAGYMAIARDEFQNPR